MTDDPVAVALKFAFLIVLYLFLLWVARSATRDLRPRTTAARPPSPRARGRRGRARGRRPAGRRARRG